MKLFRKGYEISLNRVRDNIVIREGDETLELYVDSDANSMVQRLIAAQKALAEVKNDADDEERKNAAVNLSVAMFGQEQTRKLIDFYHGDFGCVVTICGMYFSDQKNGLAKKITKAQKHRR